MDEDVTALFFIHNSFNYEQDLQNLVEMQPQTPRYLHCVSQMTGDTLIADSCWFLCNFASLKIYDSQTSAKIISDEPLTVGQVFAGFFAGCHINNDFQNFLNLL